MSYREFRQWVWYLGWEDVEAFRRQDYYLAQIAAEIRNQWAKKQNQKKPKDMMLKFKTASEEKPQLDREAYTRRSKAFWAAMIAGARAKMMQKKKRQPTGSSKG